MLWFGKVNKCLEKRKASENSNRPRWAARCFGEKEGLSVSLLGLSFGVAFHFVVGFAYRFSFAFRRFLALDTGRDHFVFDGYFGEHVDFRYGLKRGQKKASKVGRATLLA